MAQHYKAHEFAQLSGVTVKALHHYDRLGLLCPTRSDSGYRIYSEVDLEHLEQIVALKFLGLPLRKIGEILNRQSLGDALEIQRSALADRRKLLDRAIRAIEAAQRALEGGKRANSVLLRRIIEVINMQDSIEAMKRYYSSEAAWERRKRYYEEGPAPEWKELYREVIACLGEDPAGEKVQDLAERWARLGERAYNGDPSVQTDTMTAWADRENWPPAMKQRVAEYRLEEVTRFMEQAMLAPIKKYFPNGSWERYMARRENGPWDLWQNLADLFRDLEAAQAMDPACAIAQDLVARWRVYLETVSGDDPEIRSGLDRRWLERKHWGYGLRRLAEGLHQMPWDRFERTADFLDQAIAAAPNRRGGRLCESNTPANP